MKKIKYFDAHCDTVYRSYMTGEGMRTNGGHIALDRAGVFESYAQVFTFFFSADDAPEEGMLSVAKKMYDLFNSELEKNSDLIVHCKTSDDIENNAESGKTCAVLSIEGADLLECDPDNIELAKEWGVRLINPTWNCANALSGTHCRESDRGISDLGRAFVKTAEQADIMMDVSHLSEKGFWDLTEIAEKPIVASHSNSRAVFDHSRGLTDAQFKAICQTGGVVGINFYTDFVGVNPAIDDLIRHLEHFLALGGEKHVALGGDLDGCESTVKEITGFQDVPKLYEALQNRGYSKELLEDIFWNNWLRIF